MKKVGEVEDIENGANTWGRDGVKMGAVGIKRKLGVRLGCMLGADLG